MDKQELISLINQKLTEKISYLENLISETRSSNNETKSSMGDKYETGREMLQQEINNLQIQLNEVLKQQNSIKNLNVKPSTKAEKGALVKTDKGLFFISVSIGEIRLNQDKIICISAESPLAKAMMDKKPEDNFSLNQIQHQIKFIA